MDKSDFENLRNIYKSKQSVGIGFDVQTSAKGNLFSRFKN